MDQDTNKSRVSGFEWQSTGRMGKKIIYRDYYHPLYHLFLF